MNRTYQSAFDVWLLSHYTLFGSLCADVCLLSYVCITALYCTTLHILCTTALFCRIPHRWWLKVSAGSYNTSLLPSSPIKQVEGGREMEGEVVFRRDTQSNLLKAVSGPEWVYRRGALERGRRVSVNADVFMCLWVQVWLLPGCLYLCVCFWVHYDRLFSGPAGVTLSYRFSTMFNLWCARTAGLQ